MGPNVAELCAFSPVTHGLDEQPQRGRRMPVCRIVKTQTGKRLAPLRQQADEPTCFEILADQILKYPSDPDARKGCFDHQVLITQRERAVDVETGAFTAECQIPAVQRAALETEPDTLMMLEILGRFW
ncbi:hypothetical protein WT23_17900 [Burkholderia territorii]|nr:hypothetical protein WT23_17900 [Burkholderia territorii]